MKRTSRSKKNFIVLKQKNDVDKIINFFMNSSWRKLGSSWSSWDKSQWNGRIQEVPEFHLRHCCKTKIGRGSGHYLVELTDKIQELQNEINCMNDSRDFQDAEPVRSGNSHDTSQPVSSPTSSNSWRNAKPFLWNAEPQRWAVKYLGHAWYIRKRFCKSSRVFYSTLSAGSESMEFRKRRADSLINSGKEWEANTSSRSEMPVWTVSQQFCHPLVRETLKNCGADQQRLQISDLHFDKFTTPATFLCWKIRFKTEACTCSQFPTEAMQWIKEVEMVDSVDDLISSSSIRGTQMPNFEVFYARTASALNRTIILTSKEESVRRNKRPRSRTVSFVADRLLTWFANTSGSLEPTILSRIMPTYLQFLFELMIFRNSIQSWTGIYCLWRKFHLMTSWKDCTN